MRRLILQVTFVSALTFGSNLQADVVLDWNSAALDAIRASNTSPPIAARNLAILHASIFDAVNGIARTHTHYFVTGNAPASASIDAAAAAAAHSVLSSLYPARSAAFESLYLASIQAIADGPQKDKSVAWGRSVAQSILAWRAGDGWDRSVTYIAGTAPGDWRPTISFGGEVRPAMLPEWGTAPPFAMPDVALFRPPAPPALNSPEYTNDFKMVKRLGAMFASTRTADETQIALFWGYGPRTATPPGHWNQIARAVVQTRPMPVAQNARLFALLNLALADAGIMSWDCKYTFNFWRPVTAIREAHTDGNPNTEPDSLWTPLLATPPFPEYISGHSSFSAAAAVVLGYFFGDDHVPFTVGSDDLPGVTRLFERFSDAARESGISRIYGGIHFMSANRAGLSAGAAVGRYVIANYLLAKENHSRDQ